MLGRTLRSRRFGTATTVLGVVAASLVAPVLTTPVLGSASVAASTTGIAAPVETNLTARTVDLGTLGGRSSEATAVDGSIVVGASKTDVPNTRHAFAYDLAAAEPVMVDLGTLRGRSEATAVDGTVVVGMYDSGSEDRFRAFAYDLAAAEPAMRDLGTLGGGYAVARDVEGTIVTGMSQTASGERHAFVYDLAAAEPEMIDLGTLGGGSSDGVAVDGSVVVGGSATAVPGEYHAFAYDLAAAEPVMRDLGTLGGGYSFGLAVDGSLVVGVADTASGETHAFAYDLAAAEPAMQDLGTLGGPVSRGVAVDGTTVVGSSDTASGDSRAFTYDLAAAEPAMQDLGTVRGAGAATEASASGIDGDIVIGGVSLAPYGSAFAYDLGADAPRILTLGSWKGSGAADVDGDVVVGSAHIGFARRATASTQAVARNRSARHATAWVLRETTRPMIAFQRFERRVEEGVGRVTLRVTRYGSSDRAVTVRYRTRGDTAKAGKDFMTTSGKLRFPRGATHRSFRVKILNDRRREGNEYLQLILSRPSNPALLGTPSWSQLRINKSDG